MRLDYFKGFDEKVSYFPNIRNILQIKLKRFYYPFFHGNLLTDYYVIFYPEYIIMKKVLLVILTFQALYEEQSFY